MRAAIPFEIERVRGCDPSGGSVIHIRPEENADVPRVRDLTLATYATDAEALLLDALRPACADLRSFVAEEAGVILAHALFTPASPARGRRGLGLGPMSVLPERQNRGVGTELLERALEFLAADGVPWVIVLGHPRYYPRFGFRPACVHGLECPWPGVPDPAFLALELVPGGLEGVGGVVRYRPEFDSVI